MVALLPFVLWACSNNNNNNKRPPLRATPQDVQTLASATVALLQGGDAVAALDGASRRDVVGRIFEGSERLDEAEAESLFSELALEVVRALASAPETNAATAYARRLVRDEGAAERAARDLARKLLAVADSDADGQVSSRELQRFFDVMRVAPLDDVVGSLQLLPEHLKGSAFAQGEEWHARVPGDAHVLKRWVAPDFKKSRLSIVGIGRSADASAYYLPELGIVLDAGLAVKSLEPRAVLLSHAHRDHVQALPGLARRARFGEDKRPPARVYLPYQIEPLARRFCWAEAVLNFGREQTPQETIDALGDVDLRPVRPGDHFSLDDKLSVRVFGATHKVPAVAYGLYERRKRLDPAYAGADPEFIKRNREQITHYYEDGLLFYSGDTTIGMLETNELEILGEFRYVVHECTFLGIRPDDDDQRAAATGHTHYAQLHPFICRHPNTTFILVHFSTRYSKEDVLNFFDSNYAGRPSNVVLWL
ncbi:hypothetical protein CTAYLR_001754 [Chrysophaeum taylorii]|uniref:EF-hand domain-containing protein n=1 Tax=Chrysophaeum taylorii TaxID=2483200 RepID=A0AAD7UGN4_9STRA|nr:hypothetical protein CTAYLR_001754 [Chrysophaeum taylorii]